MKMNWKLRLKNKATLAALVAGTVALAYQAAGWVGIVPHVSGDEIISACGTLINLLVLLGIVVDPTTEGVADSEKALSYAAPGKEG